MRLTEFEKIADILGRQHKIQAKEGEGWASNIEKRIVYYRKKDIYTLSEDHILGLLLHETAHIHYTTKTEPPQENKELFQSALNMVEDISIEHIISSDYPNAGEILKSTETELLDTLVRMLPKMANTPKHEKALLYAAIRFRGRGYTFPFEDYEKVGEIVSKLMLSRELEIYNRKKTADLKPLINDILEIIVKELGKPTDQERRQMDGGLHGEESDERTQTASVKKALIQKLSKGWENNQEIESTKVIYIDEIADQARQIGKKLRAILKRNNAMEFGGRFRTGKLKTRSLIRIETTKDRKPFARRIVKSNQSYAFAVASDVSGSMFNRNYQNEKGEYVTNASYALSSLHMVAEALRIANIPRSVMIFGHRSKLISPMTKSEIRWQSLASDKAFSAAKTSGTDISKAMEMSIQQLKNTKAERKIMVVLTDGESNRLPMQIAKKKADEENIECIGITIGHSYQMDSIFAKKNTVIPNNEDNALIGKAFIDILKSTITKG